MSEKMVKAVVVYFPLDVWEKMANQNTQVMVDGYKMELSTIDKPDEKIKARKRTVRKRWLQDGE